MTSKKTNYTESIVTSSTISSSSYVPPQITMRRWMDNIARTSPPNKFSALRNAYKAFKNFMNDNVHFYNSEDELIRVPCIVANQERAIAKINQEKNLILPILSLSLEEVDEDEDRRKYGDLITYQTYWDTQELRAQRIISEAPKQISLTFSLNLWAKYMSELVQVSELIEFMFRPNLEIKNPHAYNTKYFLEASSDISTKNATDGDNRIIRKTFQITCDTYAYGPRFRITNTGEIEEFNVSWEIES
jgi:hypothetical protein